MKNTTTPNSIDDIHGGVFVEILGAVEACTWAWENGQEIGR